MKHLAARLMPVADPVANGSGEILHCLKDRPAVVVNRLPGQSVTAPTETHRRSVGEILAQMHLAGSDYPRNQSIREVSIGGTRWRPRSAATCLADSGRCFRANWPFTSR
ncbi:phosphotransferase [Mesorhizobium sp.]|uniref:phosphotransferase n=1 Tax=Mesorhizobium sp. TaxID=1871066 RepID=UPI00344E9A46